MFWLKRACTLFFIACMSYASSSLAVTPNFWRETGYLYQANQTPVRKILEDFANQFGVMLSVDANLHGTVDGRISATNAVEFLDRLALTRKFRWFVYANTLYISPMNDHRVENIPLDGENAGDLRQVLVGVGLFEPRFGWAERNDAQTIIVTGPSSYIRLVKQILGKKEAPKNDIEIMIFRLRYANAEDREIQYRNRSITTPGVATILRNLLQEKRGNANRNVDIVDAVKNPFSPNLNQTAGRVLNQVNGGSNGSKPPPNPFAFLGGGNAGNGDNSLDQPAQNTGNQEQLPNFQISNPKKHETRNVLVESDARMNAVIIRDDPSKRDYYQRLIEQFDTQPKMVEIEALIIDINRSKMRDIGIDWGLKSGNNQIGVSAMAGAGLSQAATVLAPGSSVLLKNLERFYANVRALEQNGDAYVLAKPSVLTVDNLGAVLDLSQTAYIKIQGERVADVLPVTAGTMLRVTPRVIRDQQQDKIHLLVDIEDGTVQEKQGGATPSVQKSTISTQAIIDENQALIIGGYQSQNTNRFRQKVPLLGDIPIIGGLFTTTQNNDSEKERLFVIIPRALARTYQRPVADAQAQEIAPAVKPFNTRESALAGQVYPKNDGNAPTTKAPPNPFFNSNTNINGNSKVRQPIWSGAVTANAPSSVPVIEGVESRVIKLGETITPNAAPPIRQRSIQEVMER